MRDNRRDYDDVVAAHNITDYDPGLFLGGCAFPSQSEIDTAIGGYFTGLRNKMWVDMAFERIVYGKLLKRESIEKTIPKEGVLGKLGFKKTVKYNKLHGVPLRDYLSNCSNNNDAYFIALQPRTDYVEPCGRGIFSQIVLLLDKGLCNKAITHIKKYPENYIKLIKDLFPASEFPKSHWAVVECLNPMGLAYILRAEDIKKVNGKAVHTYGGLKDTDFIERGTKLNYEVEK